MRRKQREGKKKEEGGGGRAASVLFFLRAIESRELTGQSVGQGSAVERVLFSVLQVQELREEIKHDRVPKRKQRAGHCRPRRDGPGSRRERDSERAISKRQESRLDLPLSLSLSLSRRGGGASPLCSCNELLSRLLLVSRVERAFDSSLQ